jgi:hypothetical protein
MLSGITRHGLWLLLLGVLFLSTLFCSTWGLVWADSVKLTNNWRRYTGNVIRVDETSVVFQGSDGKAQTWPRSLVSDIRFDVPAAQQVDRQGGPLTAFSGSGFSKAPAPRLPGSRANSSWQGTGVGASGIVFTGQQDPDPYFTWLVKFKGKTTKTNYVGLYKFPDRGSCWLKLPQPLARPSQLSFEVLGKWNPRQQSVGERMGGERVGPESFAYSARFLAANGVLLGEAPIGRYVPTSPQLKEWFEYLDNMAGVASPQTVTWTIPARTQTIEWFVPMASSQGPNQLMGYMTHMRVEN